MKIVVTGGGTGGHVFPGLAVASALKGHQVVYAGCVHGFEKKVTERYHISFYPIASRGLAGRNFLGKIFSLYLTSLGFLQAVKFLRRFKPDVVVGTGGYVSFPVVLASLLQQTPTLILEQNLLPGKTTRILSPRVTKVLASFEETKPYLPKASVIVTGNPVRPEIGSLSKEEGCRRLAFSPDKPVIVVMGASQGARALNQALLHILPELQNKSWQILHLTGETHYQTVLQESKTRHSADGLLTYRALPFSDDIAAIYAAGDLIVSRAGGTTLAEITVSGKASVLIPYPYAAENHQEINARWLEARGGCRVILNRDLTANLLLQTLEELINHPETLKSMAIRTAAAARPDALSAIMQAIQNVSQRKT